MMRKLFALVLAVAVVMPLTVEAKKKQEEPKQLTIQNQWYGKRVAYLGDSITDERQTTTQKVYWQYLEELLGIVPTVYGISGNQWHQIIPQAERMIAKQGQEVDAILIFMGTNDYGNDTPLGEWYTQQVEKVQLYDDGRSERRWTRRLVMDNSTTRGRINKALDFLKKNYPTKQLILLTPIHRGIYMRANGEVMPHEGVANRVGHFHSEYVEAIHEAGAIWGVPVIDFGAVSGLMPTIEEHGQYFRLGERRDRLHPNTEGQRRMAQALMYQLLAYPASFE
jgi:lysophospholipase L1-like esterase